MACLALVLIAGFMSACRSEPGPEAEIRALLAELEEAAEEGRIGDFCGHLAEDYSDNRGNDLASLRGELFIWQQRGGGFTITSRIDTVTVLSEREASATVIAGVADGPILSAETRARVFGFELELVRDGGRWLVRRVVSRDSDVVELLGG